MRMEIAGDVAIEVMRMEIAGDVAIECPVSGYSLKLSFKNKGYFKGTNNSVEGKIQKTATGETVYKLDGRWDKCINITEKKTGKTRVFFDVEAEKASSFQPPTVDAEANQQYFESRRVWGNVTKGLRTQNVDMATEHKSKLEDAQRAGKKERDAFGTGWEPKIFKDLTPGQDPTWQMRLCKFDLADGSEEGYEASEGPSNGH
ncbi:hypothetical protein T484DRAFT_1792669 [Baffinella frigidus]|nr:hypothetical protein T484DRAFT_1792669 [Cryptophyta sp. CCMP2293]